MSKRSWVNIFLIALVSVVTVYINKNPVTDNKVTQLTDLTPEMIDTIVIQQRDKEEMIFEKGPQGWLISSPIEGTVQTDKINLLLKFVTLKSRHQHKITKPQQLQRYELDNPKVSLFMNDQQFDFGLVNDFNKFRYVLHDGVVHSLKDITYHLLIADAESFKQ